MAESLEARVKKDPKLLARVLKNPGLRSKLPAKYLTKDQQARRKTNARLAAPIVAGSTTTEGGLANESKAAMDVRYGPRQQAEQQTLGEEKTRLRDTSGFYDQYLAQVAQHARNVQGIGGAAAQTGLGLQQGITGLAGASLTGLQNPATADAAARGAQAGDLSGMASSAAAIRQALVGSFVAQQAGQSAAASNYADTQAHVVAPGQKLGAQAMGQGRIREAGEKIKDTATERGQADFAFRAERRADEAKSLLAEKIAGVNEADKKADNKLATDKLTETTRSHKASEKEAAKKRRADQRKADKEAVENGKKPNSYGVPADQWAKWSTSHRQRVIDAKAGGGKGKGKDKKGGKGPDWVTPNESGAAMTQLGTLKDLSTRARTGAPFVTGHAKQTPLTTREQVREKVRQYAGNKLKHPALLDAAVDAIFDKFLRAETVRALITAGYKPSEVARTLGVQTSGQVKASDPKPTTNG